VVCPGPTAAEWTGFVNRMRKHIVGSNPTPGSMKLYKLRHKPTGQFFKPSKHGSKTNLAKTGKFYDKKVTVAMLSGWYEHSVFSDDIRKIVPEDWELVEYSVVEVGVVG
jgi:hypothetical protein